MVVVLQQVATQKPRWRYVLCYFGMFMHAESTVVLD
jgi:hypothetical protein